jgi:hypothetical protein
MIAGEKIEIECLIHETGEKKKELRREKKQRKCTW